MADSCYALNINFNSGGQFCSSVMHRHFDDGGFTSTQAAAAALIDAFDTHARTAIRAILPGAVTIISYKARKVSGVGGFEAIKLISGSNAGTRSGSMMASGVGPVAIFLPPSNGKARGKWFLPGLSSSDCDAGFIGSSFYNTLTTQLAIIIANNTLTGGGGPTSVQAIYNRVLNSWTAIDEAYWSATIGTQRRRQRPA